jgi:hypothetical protein
MGLKHVDLPKQFHGWREFLKEVGIIVLGVLIALSADQLAERYNWRLRVGEARTALNEEIADAAGTAQERIAYNACANRRLDELHNLVMNAGPAIDRPLIVSRYHTVVRPWSEDIWETMIAAGVMEHMPHDELLRYAAMYDLIRDIREQQLREEDSISDLALLTSLRGRFLPVTRDRLLTAVTRARRNNDAIVRDSEQLLQRARELGIRPAVPDNPPPCNSMREPVEGQPRQAVATFS